MKNIIKNNHNHINNNNNNTDVQCKIQSSVENYMLIPINTVVYTSTSTGRGIPADEQYHEYKKMATRLIEQIKKN